MTSEQQPLVTVVILTQDEELNLPHCLKSLQLIGADVCIVDSGSNDRTLDIAKQYGCRVYHHDWTNYATQFNWGLDNCEIATAWTMRMDADERITPELATEINQTLRDMPSSVTGFLIKRRVYFWGKWLRHGGYYPTWLLRLWRTGKGRCEQRSMDEHIVVEGGDIQRLQADIIDENHKGLDFWINKHNSYASREAFDLLAIQNESSADFPQGQAGQKRWLKKNVYSRTPKFLRAHLYWVYRYFLRLGFLDGKEGFVFHFLQAYWYRLLVDAKLHESEQTPGERD
jgi:glycosyltransferase involved in cell wall biosynthesis